MTKASNSRRSFIKKTALSTAAITVGGVPPGFSAESYDRILGANEKIRVSVMGVNSRGNALATNFTQLGMFSAINKGTSLNADIDSGHKSTLLVQLGNIVPRTGNSLDIDPANGHIINDEKAQKLWSRTY